MLIKNIVFGFTLLTVLFPPLAHPAPRDVVIGMVTGGPYYSARECWERFKREMAAFAGDEFRFQYPEEYQLVDNWDPEEVAGDCRKLLEADAVDIIVALGLEAPAYFAAQRNLEKPVVLFGEFDLELMGIEDAEGRSRITNLTFQVDRGKYRRDVKKIKELARGRTVTVLIDQEILQTVPGLKENADRLASEAGLELEYASYRPTVDETIAALPAGTEFIYLTPSYLFNTRAKIRRLLEEINRLRIPTFALEGRPVVELGALAGLYSGSTEKIARNNALKIYEILKGEAPEDLSVYFQDKQRFTINLETARRIDFFPGFDRMMEAELINVEAETGPLIELRDAVSIALANNLSYRIVRRRLEEADAAYRQVLANLFPQLGAEASYQRVDTDRAKASLGIQPRWESAAGVQLDQLIFDYSVWKSVSLARLSVTAAERDLEIAALDTARNALVAYFTVLQARELVRIQQENLTGTRNHLDIARIRREEGAGSREEVLRLEAQYQSALADLIEADFELKKTKIRFNEVLNRPQEAGFRLEDLSPENPGAVSIFSAPDVDTLLFNQRDSDLLRNFLVGASDRYSPEIRLARLNVAIAEEDLSRARAGIWSPSIGARARYDRRLGEEVWNPDGTGGGRWSGSGSYPDDNEWALVGYVRIPLWKGGSNWADLAEKKVSLEKARQTLRLQEQATALAIRSAYFDLAASSTNFELDRKREKLAAETLELVEDKYRNGTLPLIDLLDAQSEHVNARAATVASFYASITDLIELERQTGFLEYLASAPEGEKFVEDMKRHLQDHKSD